MPRQSRKLLYLNGVEQLYPDDDHREAIASFRTSKKLAATYSGGGVTRADAKRSALERCNGDARARRTCRVRAVVCGDGR